MLSILDLRSTLQTNEFCFVKFSCIWPNFTFPGGLVSGWVGVGWGNIKIKDNLSPTEAETYKVMLRFFQIAQVLEDLLAVMSEIRPLI